jgi:PAS domain S-box-containing protein
LKNTDNLKNNSIAGKDLRQSEQTFRAITESAIDAIITVDSKGIITFFNQSLLELFGYSASELSGKPVSILIPEKHKKGHSYGMKSFKNGKKHRTGKTSPAIGLKKNGTEFPCEMSLAMWKSGEDTYFTSIIRDLTERKKTDAELLKAKDEWENTFNAVPDLIAILDNDYRVIRANKAMEDSLGVKKGDAVGVHCYEAVHGTNSPPLFCPHTLLLEDGHEHTAEVHEDRIGGDFIVSVSPLHDSEGKLMGSVHVARDITERKKVEEALKESEEKFREIFNKANDMISLNVMNNDGLPGKFLEVNQVASDRLGYTRNELLKMSPPEIVAPENRSQMQGNAAKLLEKGHNTFEIFHITKDGIKIPVEINNHLINYKGQKICLAISRDITERKSAEEDLRLSQIRLANAMDLANLANWELDAHNQMFIFNDKFYSMLGTSLDIEGSYSIPIAHYIKEYVHPEDAQFITEGMKKSLEIQEPTFGTEFEHRIIRRDGEIRYMAIHIRVIPPTESKNARIFGAVQDVTEHKIAENKLKESLEEKEMLLKEIHHRVKNNLMVISSLLNLQSRYIKDKEALDIFKESQNRAKSMALIHERLYRSTDLKKIDFGDYIHTLATDLFRTYISDPSLINLKMNLENVMVDINTTVPLGLIVNELVTNSMKHAFPKGAQGDINIEFYKKEDVFTLIVSDTGVGFPEDLDFRNTASLGLQLVNNLVSQIDGEITLDKSYGTEFKITFEELEYKKRS